MPPRGLPTLVVLPPVASSSVAPLSSASFCGATAACRSLALAASPASRRSSALLAAYFGPSSLSSSPLARTTLLTPTPIICRPVMLLLRSTLSSTRRFQSNESLYLGWTHPSTREEPCSNPNCLDLSCKNETFLELPHPVVAASHPWRRAAASSRTRPRRRVEARCTDQAATPKRRPIETRERHAQQYGRRPLSRAAAWSCVARTSRVASVEPLEEPARAVDGSRSPRRRERLRGRGFRRPPPRATLLVGPGGLRN